MSRRDYSTVVLPGGYFDAEGARYREASVRPLRGWEEEWAAAVPAGESQAGFVTELLSRVVRSVGPFRGAPSLIRELLVVDREYLLLRVIAASFGGRMEMTLACADPRCGAKMDASFDIDEIPLEPGSPAASYRLTGSDVVFRLPTGADQEDVADARLGPDAAVRRLLERCILQPSGPPALDPALWDRLAEEMERVAPRVDLEIEAACPECGRTASYTLDPVSRFVGEMSRRRAEFEGEVHLLAFYYHWPLRELLGLSCERRRHWSRLLTGALERQTSASYV